MTAPESLAMIIVLAVAAIALALARTLAANAQLPPRGTLPHPTRGNRSGR